MPPIATTKKTFRDKYRKGIRKVGVDEDFLVLPDEIELEAPSGAVTLNVKDDERYLLFRGDDRFPEDIYEKGFYNRIASVAPSFKTHQGDIDGKSGTCASLRPDAGCLFPLQADRGRTAVDPMRLYAIYTDVVYKTHVVQNGLLNDSSLMSDASWSVKQRLKLNAWADEVVVWGDIPGDDVLGYFRVWRSWKGGEYQEGLDFKIDPKFLLNKEAQAKHGRAFLQLTRECEEKIAPLADKECKLRVIVTDIGARQDRNWSLTVP